MQKIDSVSCGDEFTAAATIADVLGSSGGGATVSANDAFVAVQYAPARGQTIWTNEVHAPQGGIILAPGTTGVRFRNYVAGKVAVVSANLSFPREPPITFTAAGTATSPTVNFLGRFTQTTWPPASAADGDVAYYFNTSWQAGFLMVYVASANHWTIYNSDPSSYAEVVGTGTSGDIIAPVFATAGTYTLAMYGQAQNSGAATFTFKLGTTSGGTEITSFPNAPAAASVRGYGNQTGIALTATAGETLHGQITPSGGALVDGNLQLLIQIVTLANA